MSVFRDVTFALRTLRKSPGFSITAILALSLGIGANSAMFSVIEGILLRPLPFPQPDRLVNVWDSELKRNIPRMVLAPGDYYDFKARNQVFSGLAGFMANTFNLASTEGEPERYIGALCDPDFFTTLQVNPFLGRNFAPAEDSPGRDNVVVIGYDLWTQRFGSDRNIVGQNLVLDGAAKTVIGVMPKGFQYPAQALMWAPLALDSEMRARHDFHRLRVIGRLRDGISLERARSDLHTLSSQLAAQFPSTNKDEDTVINPVLDDAVGQIRPALYLLVGAVGFVLLVACANVANLLLAKSASRQREIAIRSSLGAGRTRIITQMLTESVLLAMAGGLLGLLFAYGAFQTLIALAPSNLPRLNQVNLNWTVVAYTVSTSLLTGVLFGPAPAFHAAKADVHSLLKEGARSVTAPSGLRSTLVVAQVSIALVLLVGAGLLIRSFYRIAHVDAGFQPEHVMTMRLAPAAYKYRGHPDLQISSLRI